MLKNLKKRFMEWKDYPRQQDLFKSKFEYWDDWTGSRFERRRNPYADMSQVEWVRSKRASYLDVPQPIDYVPGSVCRVDPVTGEWKAL